MERTISVWSDRNIQDQLWRWSSLTWFGHFSWSDQNVPFNNLTKLLSSVPLFCILFTRTMTKHAVAWVGSVQPECTIPLGTWNFRNFKPEFLLNGKGPRSTVNSVLKKHIYKMATYSWSLSFFTPFIWLSIRQTLNTGPKVVCVRNSWLYVVYKAMFWCF